MAIGVNGHTMRAWVNGKMYVSTTLAADARFPDGTIPRLNRARGRIGSQKPTGTVRFCNMTIRELTQTKSGGLPTRP